MKYFFALFVALLFRSAIFSQDIIKEMPTGFDTLQTNIPHGKIDSFNYKSKTVGTARQSLIYTPPGYSKKEKYPVLYLLHGIGGYDKE